MEKYKVSFLPTGRSRKMKTLFLYAETNTEAIKDAKKRIKILYPDGEMISIQGPDFGFVDLPGRGK